jgi:hypothetical protein
VGFHTCLFFEGTVVSLSIAYPVFPLLDDLCKLLILLSDNQELSLVTGTAIANRKLKFLLSYWLNQMSNYETVFVSFQLNSDAETIVAMDDMCNDDSSIKEIAQFLKSRVRKLKVDADIKEQWQDILRNLGRVNWLEVVDFFIEHYTMEF